MNQQPCMQLHDCTALVCTLQKTTQTCHKLVATKQDVTRNFHIRYYDIAIATIRCKISWGGEIAHNNIVLANVELKITKHLIVCHQAIAIRTKT